MTKPIEDIIQEADQLIEEEQYREAWQLLLPHQNNQSARIRLRWIRANQKRIKNFDTDTRTSQKQKSKAKPDSQTTKIAIGLFVFICGFCFLVSLVSTNDSTNPEVYASQEFSERLNITPPIDMTPFDERLGYIVVAPIARDCPQANCRRVQVYQGENLPVIGVLEGETLENFNIWYVAVKNNSLIYVHGNSINFTGPTPIVPTHDPRLDHVQPVYPTTSNSSSSRGTSWSCNIDYDCEDFSGCSSVMSYWNACPGDPSQMDGDGDNRPCEMECGG